MSSNVSQLDTKIQVIAPENIAFDYHVAGPFRRFPAYLLDLLFRGTALFALALAMALMSAVIGSLGIAVWITTFFLLSWFYGGFFEAYWNGQTPGKRIMRLRVLSTSGRPINGHQAVLRNLLRLVDMMFGIGLIAMACTARFQRLGDLVCRTMVVAEGDTRFGGLVFGGIARIEDPRVFELASYLPSDLQVSRSMAEALAMYAERRANLTPSRQQEVAGHVAKPLLRQYGLPDNTSCDLLLCSMYYRVFIADRGEDEQRAARAKREQQARRKQPLSSA